MGILRDAIGGAIGSATGANQPNNGFNGPNLPFRSNNNSRNSSTNRFSASSNNLNVPSAGGRRYSNSSFEEEYQTRPYRPRSAQDDYRSQQYRRDDPYDYPDRMAYGGRPPSNSMYLSPNDPPPYEQQQPYYGGHDQYPPQSRRGDVYQEQYYAAPLDRGYSNSRQNSRDSRGSSGFRPFALPQTTYGDGSPFLRGYSHELDRYGITEQQFIRVVDAVNVAIIPNPEAQLFQKGANIAGWFLPGAASIGLMAGQVGVGIGTAFGHSSMVAKSLSKANLDLFLPQGLEICIAKTQMVDQEVGISSYDQQSAMVGSRPEDRIAAYGDLLAPLTVVLPPQQTGGRSDPIAMLGRGMAKRDNQKKMSKAQEEIGKGKNKDANKLEKGMKWLMVRQASPGAKAKWQETLQQSDAALKQEQAQAAANSAVQKR